MTEDEWFRATDARRLVGLASGKVSPRKLRLFMVAWCRHNMQRVPGPISEPVAVLAEQFADGKASKKQLEAMFDEGRSLMTGFLIRYLLWPDSRQMEDCVDGFCLNDHVYTPLGSADQGEAYHAHQAIRAAVFRDIVGNPFRPVVFAPEWRTTTAVVIAKGVYESRDFTAMPILADALQDAGCDNADVLSHCRDPQHVHVRGCWVVDLVLGKC